MDTNTTNLKDPNRRLWGYLGVVLGLYLLVFGLQLGFKRPYLTDSQQYIQLADNLLDHGVFYGWDLDAPIDPEGYTQRPPLYPLLILLFRVFTDSPYPLLFAQALWGVFNCWGLYRFWEGLPLRVSPLWSMIPALLLFPSQLIYSQLVMSELLFQSCIIWSFLFFVRFMRDPQPRYLLFYNLLLCAGLLTKPVLYLFWLPNVGVMGWLAFRHKNWRFWAMGGLPIATILLYCGLNYARTGYYHFSSITAINLLHYNAYHTLLDAEGAAAADSTIAAVRTTAFQIDDFGERETFMKSAATRLLLTHKGTYLKLHLKGMLNFFMDPGRFDLYHFFGLQKTDFKGLLYYFSRDGYRGVFRFLQDQPTVPAFTLVLVMAWNALLLVSLFNFIFIRQISWEIRVLGLFLVFYVCAVTGPLGASRFKVPVYPLLVLTVPFLWDRIRQFGRGLWRSKASR